VLANNANDTPDAVNIVRLVDSNIDVLDSNILFSIVVILLKYNILF
jgi:hypothetical protein